jgi:flagellin
MSMRINQNVLSQSTYASLSQANNRLESSISKLSSGLRINSAADDAAGLAISEKMRRQIRGLERAQLNAQDGISMVQTAEGALGETQGIIQRMRELALQSANDTLTSNDRLEIQKEVEELKSQIDSIADSTQFNTKKLLNGNQSALVSSSSKAIAGVVTGEVSGNGDYDFSLETVSGGVSQMQGSQILTNKNTGALAKGSDKLTDIGGFYTDNGTFALESAQKLSLTGNGKSASITLDGQMTLNDVAASLQNALSSQSGLGIANSKVSITGEGTISITSGSIGSNGEFSIAGSQDVLDGLGFSVTRAAVDSMVKVSMTDVYGNSKSVTTSSDRAGALLDGIDVQFKSQAAQIAGMGGIVDGLKFDAKETLKLQVGNSAEFSITVAQGPWSLDGIARNINEQIATENAKSGGAVEGKLGGLSASVVDGEIRINYNPTGEGADNTLIKVTGESGTLGIRTGEYNGFVTGAKDSSKAIQGVSAYNELGAKVKDALKTVSVAQNALVDGAYKEDGEHAYKVASIGKTVALSAVISAIHTDASGSTGASDVKTALDAITGDFSAATKAQLEDLATAMEALATAVEATPVTKTLTATANTTIAAEKFGAVVSAAAQAARALANAHDTAEVTINVGDGEGDSVAAINYATKDDAKVADLKEIKTLVASINATMAAAGVDAIADVVNGSLVFTSSQVGTSADGVKSVLKMEVEAGASLAANFGLGSATSYGSGDSEFKLHVVDTKAQLQIGADSGDNMRIGISNMSTRALGLDKIDLTSVEGAEKSLEKLNQALDKVSSERSKLGAYQNRLEYTINNLQNTGTNLSSAESRIRDVDMAKEMIEYTRNQIVSQAGISMLAQANSIPQNALSLLR